MVVRVRPPLPRELSAFRPYADAVLVGPAPGAITLSENLQALANNGCDNGMVRASVAWLC